MNKKSVCVVFGGQSPEHEISRKSVTSILNNLNHEKYEIHMLGITKDGRWYLYTGEVSQIEDGSWEKQDQFLTKAIISPDASDHGLLVFENGGVRTLHIDVVFPVLHGECGEDGTIQGLLELTKINYVGMGVAASACSMDKTITKTIVGGTGIPQADWVVVTRDDSFSEKADEIEKKLGYPCFVKPAGTGSSVGVGKASDRVSLLEALENAVQYDSKVLVEENIDGREVECAVLGNREPQAAEVGEIVPTVEFYDFDAKYVDNSTKLYIPAPIPKETREEIRGYALKAFQALNGRGLSRVDFFIRNSDGKVIFNEINTMPGFTNISMYPKLWMAAGLEYSALLDRLIELAEERR